MQFPVHPFDARYTYSTVYLVFVECNSLSNNRYRGAENPGFIHELPLYDENTMVFGAPVHTGLLGTFYVHGSVHRKSVLINVQRDARVWSCSYFTPT